MSSITGEKIAESQVVESVQSACQFLGMSLRQFTLTPAWGEPPGYTLFVDWNHRPAETDICRMLMDLATTVDAELSGCNVEYAEKRDTGRLTRVNAVTIDSEIWHRFTSVRQSRSGGSVEQYKHPCLMPDPRFEELFLKACGIKGT